MVKLSLIASAIALTLSSVAAFAHEYWIDPAEFSVAPGEEIVASTRVGQNFGGSSYAYLPQNYTRFEIFQNGAFTPVEGRIGDRPALRQVVPGTGLSVVVNTTRTYSLTYDVYEDFIAFLEHKDAMWVDEVHREKGYPLQKFGEKYSRYAKSLIAVGNGAGADQSFGLLTEIVALKNPYTDDLSDGMEVQILYEDAPRAGAQLEVFEKSPEGDVVISLYPANASGIARFPVKPGHRYMLDSVVLKEIGPDEGGTDRTRWASYWANLTFGVPGN